MNMHFAQGVFGKWIVVLFSFVVLSGAYAGYVPPTTVIAVGSNADITRGPSKAVACSKEVRELAKNYADSCAWAATISGVRDCTNVGGGDRGTSCRLNYTASDGEAWSSDTFYSIVCPASHPYEDATAARCYDNPELTGDADPAADPLQVDPQKDNGCGGAMEGNPCNAATGNKFQTEVDYRGAGVFPLQWVRYYNSLDDDVTAFGSRWRSHYDRHLDISQTEIIARRQDGTRLVFALSGSTWVADPDVHSRIEVVSNGYQFIDEADNVESYNSVGRLLAIATRDGKIQTLTYNGAGRLSSVTDPASRQLTFSYDGNGRVVSMTDPAGQVMSYDYDASGMLSAAIFPDNTPATNADNPRRQYRYEDVNSPQALTGLIDENGVRFATWEYAADGRVISSEHAGGVERVELTYDANRTTTSVRNTLGETKRYDFDIVNGVKRPIMYTRKACDTCTEETKFNDYDAASGEPTFTSGYDSTFSTATYNSRGLVQNVAYPLTSAGQRITTYVWHATFRVPLSISDSASTIYFAYDASGRLIQRTETDNATSVSRVWQYTYNAAGLLASVDGPRTDVTDVTLYTYDAQGDLASVTDALGHVYTVNAVDAHGRITTLTDANGVAKHWQYDVRGRLVQLDDGSQVTHFSYDPAGRLSHITLPDLTTLTYTFDAAGRLTDIVDDQGNRVVYQYDTMSQRVGTHYKNPNGQVVQQHAWAYALNRLTSYTQGGSYTTTYDYGATSQLRVTETDANGVAALRQFDPLGSLVSEEIDPNGLDAFAAFEYDVRANLTSVSDRLAELTTFTLDGFSARTTEISPVTGATQFIYNAAGNVVTKTDAQSAVTHYTYDALSRVTSINYPGSDRDVTFYYDTGALCSNGVGRLCRVVDGAGESRFAYDAQGRVTRHARNLDGQSYVTLYAYTAGGRLSQITYPDGRVMTYQLNAAGRVQGAQNGSSTVVSARSYNGAGQLVSQTFGNGVAETRSYNVTGRLTQISTGSLGAASYVHDNVGNITQWSDGLGTRTYGYDALHRLITETGPQGSRAYSYDLNGNLLAKNVSGTVYQHAYFGNMLTSRTNQSTAESESFSFDALGRLMDDRNGNRTLVYDNAGRLSSVVENAELIASYRYNYRGERIAKTLYNGGTPVQTVHYHYDLNGQLLAETASNGSAIRDYLWIDNQPVAQIAGTQTIYLVTDHLNTPRRALSANGAVVWRWSSDAYGNGAAEEDVDGDSINVNVNLRFPGQYFDQETGRYYNYFRDYDPTTGRYIESDPIGLEGGLNTYAYVGSNPLTNADSTGLVIDAIADAGFIGYDVYRIVVDNIFGNEDNLGENCAALAADAGGFFLPGATGLGLGIRAGKGVAKGVGRSVDELSQAAAVADRGGLTAAGRALQKHGGREGSAFPAAKGNPLSINQQGQHVVDDILTSPGTTFTQRTTGKFGEVLDVISPDGRGLRFGKDGSFVGLLEPPR